MSAKHPQLLAEFERRLAVFQEEGQRLADLAERVAGEVLRSVLAAATTVEVEGWMTEDWLRVLRVRRVRDVHGALLYDVDEGAAQAVEEIIDVVGTEYLDLVLDLTGDAYMGSHELSLV